jgi:hypothetical protein
MLTVCATSLGLVNILNYKSFVENLVHDFNENDVICLLVTGCDNTIREVIATIKSCYLDRMI